ncbi:hypothetical protein IEQ34_009159 [Dendrobium chrysotoxum]|uniref:Trichome birefringence-like N-terminal domain-containing protein n=1 Tax=Dendrobium chrysotoxum TaxID=161865 RepID=A0AAV7H1I9_DENCH|nr:hypothetical protein IEQ34_009159 [Dendrobium chrysotoxum]
MKEPLPLSMECKVFQNRIAPFFLWFLIIFTIFLIFSTYSSDPFSHGPKDKLSLQNQSSLSPAWPPAQPPLMPLPMALQIEEECDMFNGRWVKEPRGSPYTNESCRTLPELKNCGKYGKENGYIYWRWKPDGCDIPRFDPKIFLAIVRGKKLAFIGDSLARNHMESLLCLLSQAESPINVYKDPQDKFRTWEFPSHNFTLMVMWTEFLVNGTERMINGTGSSNFDIHLDRVNKAWADQISSLDYIIISSTNWFFRKNYLYENGNLIGCVNCHEGNLTQLSISFAVQRVFRTALKFISSCEECKKDLVTMVRTYSPSHFEHGHWFTGGYCNRSQPLVEREVDIFSGMSWELRKIQFEELGRVREEGKNNKKFKILDVTKAMLMRVDGHPGLYWPAKRNVNDCLHWCLPGPIDMWSDLLLMALRKD